MIEYTYYRSGHWKAACSECHWEHLTESIAESQREGLIHRRVHL